MKTRKNVNFSKKNIVPIVLLVLIVLAGLFYVSGGIGVKKGADDASAVAETVELLKAMENRSVPDISGSMAKPAEGDVSIEEAEKTEDAVPEVLPQPTPVPNEHPTDVDLDALREETLAHYGELEYNAVYFRDWYEDAVIVGDSVAHAFKYFGWVYNSSVQAENGINVGIADDLLLNTIYIQPKVVFLTFSANDIAKYQENIDAFIADYRSDIQYLKNEIPGVRIYVQEILPCSPDFMGEYWYYQFRDDYNARIRQMCEEEGAYSFSINFLIEEHPDIFYDDGLHPNTCYPPLAMNYMAKFAGLDRTV